ncbi:MAG: AraC family transcriptional regulator [Flavobacteriaceae bacterium]|nr:AraC family transcriptional regulator [Flavobacteriaceae bacterium]
MKNNDIRTDSKIIIEEGFYVIRFENNNETHFNESKDIDKAFIQFHFCMKGQADFLFNNGNYVFNVLEGNSILLYNPQIDLPININLFSQTWLISVIISIKKFHSLFSMDADHIHFLSPENSSKKYYDNNVISANMSVVLSQIFKIKIHKSMAALYLKGKVYELLSLYFNKNEDTDIENCPFLIDEENIRKIRLAKEIVINNISEPPSLVELSEKIGLNIKKLKEGFKQLYGDTVYSYLLDHKMEEARRMLSSRNYNVNEVGLKIGYSTSSHFIAAFKKKYGTTPKKYLMSLPN